MFSNFAKFNALLLASSFFISACAHEVGPMDAAEETLLQFEELGESEQPQLKSIDTPAEPPRAVVTMAPGNNPAAVPHLIDSSFGGSDTDQGALYLTVDNAAFYVTKATTKIGVQVVDSDGINVGEGAIVKADFSASFLPDGTQSYACMTDKVGSCTFAWTAPESAFDQASVVTVDLSAGNTSAQIMLPVFAAPQPLAINKPGAGVQLPTAAYTEGSTFSVPLYVETTGTVPGGYDIEFNFDPSKIRVLLVSSGSCEAYGAPVSNAKYDANESGSLKVIGVGSTPNLACAQTERVHMANITFEILNGAAGNDMVSTTTMTCMINDLIDHNLTGLAHNKACDFGDAMGTGTSGEVLIQAAQK